jgi:transposase
MAMGQRTREEQTGMWVAVSELPRPVSHPFYEKLNRLLAEQGFDEFVEEQCRSFYAEKMGRPSLAPGQYFRLLLLGYFEGLDSERGIAWRAADSSGVRAFLGLALTEAAPESLYDIADAAIDRSGHPSGGVHVGHAVSGHRWPSQGENDCD